MILSHFSYCVTSWSQAGSSVSKPLERLYNRAMKILGKKLIRSHHCHILESLSMLSFDNYIAFANANLIHKCLHGQAPQALCDMQGTVEYHIRKPHLTENYSHSSYEPFPCCFLFLPLPLQLCYLRSSLSFFLCPDSDLGPVHRLIRRLEHVV